MTYDNYKKEYFQNVLTKEEDFWKYIKLNKLDIKDYDLIYFDGLVVQNNKYTCFRCGNYKLIQFKELVYCNNCLEFGRIDNKTRFIKLQLKEQNKNKGKVTNKLDELTLTTKQKLASKYILSCIYKKQDVLIHAVCGAGKTEITFEAILHTLKNGGKVAFAIPRMDILYEIKVRLEYYFYKARVIVLNSKEQKINFGDIVVLTTNQIIKFHNAFSLIIVDEVDAFPYEHNLKYDYGVNKAKTKGGTIVYLTSTPSKSMLLKNNPKYIINRRWHNFLLPVPEFEYFDLNSFLKYKKDEKFFQKVKTYFESPKQLLIFISNIENVRQVYQVLINTFPMDKEKIAFVYSGKDDRLNIINSFRNKQVKVLISTTILERGVTFKNIDVIVIDASNSLYTKAALIQIAGRVNRKKDYQDGKVLFYYKKITKEMINSKQEIEKLNM